MSIRHAMTALGVLLLSSAGPWGPWVGTVTARAGAGDANWPQFRGPRGDGTTTSEKLPLTWSESENIVWKTPIEGRGWSSPVLWGKQVWMTTATPDGKVMSAICVDADSGRIIHNIKLFENAKLGPINPVNSYASPTPCIEAGRVYMHFGTYGTVCLDTATGKTLWERRDLHCDHGVGPGSSPVLDGGRLYLLFDGMDVQFVVALDAATGKTVWKTPRNVKFPNDNGDVHKAFSTPLLIDTPTGRQLIAAGAEFAMAYDPLSGRELWRVQYPGGYSTASRPVMVGGLVLVNSGFERPRVLAVRPDGRGDVTATHVAWSLDRGVANKPSPAVVDGQVYFLHDSGTLACRDGKTGQAVWQDRLDGNFSASPIAGAGRIYFFDDRGQTTVIAPGSSEMKVLATNKLDAGCMASPAVSGNALFMRTKTHLYRIESRGS
jgi:outer membrane protein assembly factor BamB